MIGLDDNGAAVGVADPLREQERLSSSISDGIEPQLLPEIYAVSYGEQELLVVDVAHHPAPFHMRAEGPDRGVYVRLGSTSRRAEPEMLAELRRQAAGESFDLFARSGVVFRDLDKTRLTAAFEGHGFPHAPDRQLGTVEGPLARLHVFRNRLAHRQRVWSHAPEERYEDLLILAGYIDPALPAWIAATSKVPQALGAGPYDPPTAPPAYCQRLAGGAGEASHSL